MLARLLGRPGHAETQTGGQADAISKHSEHDTMMALATALRLEDKALGAAATPVRLPWGVGFRATSPNACFTVESFLSADECKQLIEVSEARGYEAALVNVGGGRQMKIDEVRRSGRCIVDSMAAAELLWQRLRPFVPQEISPGVSTKWRAVGLNERLRFLRYAPGDYFAPHCDGSFVHTDGARKGQTSYMTVMMYLNEPKEDGETNFLNPRDEDDLVRVRPKPGMALCFDHRLLHEGAPLRKGVKYAIRTDVMFERIDEDDLR